MIYWGCCHQSTQSSQTAKIQILNFSPKGDLVTVGCRHWPTTGFFEQRKFPLKKVLGIRPCQNPTDTISAVASSFWHRKLLCSSTYVSKSALEWPFQPELRHTGARLSGSTPSTRHSSHPSSVDARNPGSETPISPARTIKFAEQILKARLAWHLSDSSTDCSRA